MTIQTGIEKQTSQGLQTTALTTGRLRQDERKSSPLDALRACGVMAGPSLLLDLFALGSIVAIVRGAFSGPRSGARRLMGPLVAVGAATPALYILAFRPWHQRWGATAEEFIKPLPGDELQSNPGIESTRAVTIDAPVEEVWPWLAQLGQDRGGFYSYEWLENLAGCRMRNAERIHPEWQQRTVGETIYLHPEAGLKVAIFEPNRALGIENWGTFVLEPIDERRTRLIARSRTPRDAGVLLYALFIEIPHFIMERKMLLGIKERAERASSWARAA